MDIYIYIYTVHSPGMNLNEFFSLAALLYISSMSFQMYWYTSTVTSGWRYISFVVVNVSKCITELWWRDHGMHISYV